VRALGFCEEFSHRNFRGAGLFEHFVSQLVTQIEIRAMNAHSPTISIRLPEEQRASLEMATKLTRRSRSFLVKEALERHLNDILREQTPEPPKRRLTRLLAIAGDGTSSDHVHSGDEISNHIRWLRDDD
jgi:uncharacterized protein (DUF1778 family)